MKNRERSNDPKKYFKQLLGVDDAGMADIAKRALPGAEDGEIYLERDIAESVSLDDGLVESPSREVDQGFGLRRVNGESMLFASGNVISSEAIIKAGRELRQIAPKTNRYIKSAKRSKAEPRYQSTMPQFSLAERVLLLKEIDAYARRDKAVTNVMSSISTSITSILIVRPDGNIHSDVRPMITISVSVQCTNGDKQNEKRETAGHGFGGRHDHLRSARPEVWKKEVDNAIRDAKEMLRAKPCPSGEMPVVLGPAWAGVLLHEAIGHGLEGDFVWKKTTVFADMLGKKVASDLVTVVDDGTLVDRRGSLTIDDEGTPTERTVLIKDGILVGFMHDRQSARLLKMNPTGSGRRESYKHPPQVRMRNTFMLGGESSPESMIASLPYGIYMPTFSGGQVDPLTGKFVFACKLGYMIENGKLGDPVVGATLIGDCATILLNVDAVGNDCALDNGMGTCGKGGQSVPVGIGQASLRITHGLTVGGTATKEGASK